MKMQSTDGQATEKGCLHFLGSVPCTELVLRVFGCGFWNLPLLKKSHFLSHILLFKDSHCSDIHGS